jgi:hypothetical protein
MNILIQLGLLLNAVTEIEGRKKLQKMVHILQEFGVPFEVSYGYHHYGPFSEQLQDCIQSFEHDQLIHETPVNGPYPTSKFKADERLLSLLNLDNGATIPWAPFAQELNRKSPRDLEAMSTLIYLQKQPGAQDSPENIDKAFLQLKPMLNDLLPKAKIWINEYREKYPSFSLVAKAI